MITEPLGVIGGVTPIIYRTGGINFTLKTGAAPVGVCDFSKSWSDAKDFHDTCRLSCHHEIASSLVLEDREYAIPGQSSSDLHTLNSEPYMRHEFHACSAPVLTRSAPR